MAKVAKLLGTPLMPWQRLVADVALELGPDGQLWYREVRVTVPRQSGKTTLTLALMVDRAFSWPTPQHVTYTAQSRNDARRKWEDEHVVTLEASEFRRGFTVRKSNGSEAIRWRNGSLHDLMATTRKSGHGKTLDLGVIDEAFAQPDDRLEQAMKPAMITRPDPQLWVISTAGDESSLYLWEKVESGRRLMGDADPESRIAYFEWSADPDDDPLDPATWWSCMPALGITVAEEAIAVDARSMPLDVFRRAYLNLWVRKDGTTDALPGWDECEQPKSRRDGDDLVLAVDAAPNLAWCSVAVCTRNRNGQHHLEVIHHDLGSGWVAPKVRDLVRRRRPRGVCIVPGAPAGALVPALKAAGVELTELGTGPMAKAALLLADEVKAGKIAHIGQPSLATAVGGAVRKPYGDGGFLWHRVSSSVDVSPLVAVTAALWGFETIEAPAGVDVSTQIW